MTPTAGRLALDAVNQSGYFIPSGAALILDSISHAVPAPLVVDGLFQRTDGSLVPFEIQFSNITADTVERAVVQAGPGWVLSVQARSSAPSTLRGLQYIRLGVAWSPDPASPILGLVAAGYVSFQSSVSFPGGRSEPCSTLDVCPSSLTIPTPAAGANMSFTFTRAGCHRIFIIQMTLLTSATVAVRTVQLQLAPDGGTPQTYQPVATQAASLNVLYIWHTLPFTLAATAGQNVQPFPEQGMGPNGNISTLVTNLQVGDQLSGGTVHASHFRHATS